MRTTQEILQLSDSDLLEYVCATDGDEVAYNEFLNRYLTDIQNLCDKICKWRRLHNHIGLQIAHEAFEKLRRLKSFKREHLRHGDEHKAIVGFFYPICINLFNDYYNQNKKKEEAVVLPTYFDELAETIKATTDVRDNKKTKDLTERILKKLNEKEKKVLFADIEYKRHQRYLPTEVVASLCEELNVQEAGIRKLRERAIAKIKKEINVINSQ